MSANNRFSFSRWTIWALIVIVLAILVWRLPPADLFYPSLAGGVVVAIIAALLVFRGAPAASGRILESRKVPQAAAGEEDEMAVDPNLNEEDYRNAAERLSGYRDSKPRPPAGEVVARYLKMAEEIRRAEEQSVWRPTPMASPPETPPAPPVEEPSAIAATQSSATNQVESVSAAAAPLEAGVVQGGEPPIPLIVDQSSLTEENKNELENAVWYRCENPYCKYTRFLEVHHIMDEKDGGNNKLENLIVLCPFCHDLAHKGEIPEKEMRDWIAQRDERFNSKIVWPF
jgi:hypothetical protein